MKKILISTLIIFSTIITCNAKSFYYDGVGFEYDRKWNINGSSSVIIGNKDDFQILISKERLKEDEKKRYSADKELDRLSESAMEQSMYAKKKLINISGVCESSINGIPVKYIDVQYSKKENHRHYHFEWNGYKFSIELSGKGNKFYKEFEKILSTFTFMPEHGSSRYM